MWEEQFQQYVRLYSIAWIEIARGNGKSEIDAGIALYLVMGDDEESAEIYGAAKDTKQARKVWDVAERMVKLSPVLNPLWARGTIVINVQEKRIIYTPTGSFYEVITSDAAGELGHNPHGTVFDEILTQSSPKLWDALRTGMGKRIQPLMVGTTTAGDDPSSFAAKEHKFSVRVLEDSKLQPRRFVYIRAVPEKADPWKESNWKKANPALGDFLSIQTLRDEALEARNDPTKENAFRQFRLNQWVSQTTRFMPLHLWDECIGEQASQPYELAANLDRQKCFASLDLSAKLDLSAWSLLFPLEDGSLVTVWRYWLPEDAVAGLDKMTGGQVSVWADEGWITLTEGNVIDYDLIYGEVEEDAGRFAIADVSYDPWSGEPVIQEIEKRTGLTCYPVTQDFAGMSYGTTELMKVVKAGQLVHGGNPVTRFCMDSMEVKKARDNPDLIKPVKPDRQQEGKRIDGGVTLIMGIDGFLRRGQNEEKKRGKVRSLSRR